MIIIFISFVYNVFPRLSLNGPKNVVLSYDDVYVDPGVILKNVNGDYMSHVDVTSDFVSGVVGSYHVDYSLRFGGRLLRVSRNIKVVDDIAPIIKLNGGDVSVLVNHGYKEKGYQAFDEYDGDLTDRVKVSGNVDTTISGEYVLTYEVFDSSGNGARAYRVVRVTSGY